MKQSGIYLITVNRGAKLPLYYVGQSIDVSRRRGQHITAVRAGRHDNPRLHRAIAFYGEAAISFEVLERCTPEDLDGFEAWWLSELVGYRRVTNVARVPGHPNAGRELTPEHRARIANAIRGEKHYLFGKSLSEETRAKISAGGRGLKKPPGCREAESTRLRCRQSYGGEAEPKALSGGRSQCIRWHGDDVRIDRACDGRWFLRCFDQRVPDRLRAHASWLQLGAHRRRRSC